MPQIKIGKGIGDISENTLRFYRQIGVDAVTMPTRWHERTGTGERKLVPPTQTGPKGSLGRVWDEEEVKRVKERIESFGLTPLVAGLGISGNVLMGKEGRDDDLEVMKANIEIAGRLGLRALNYSFTALRASEGYAAQMGAGRGGADLRDFDHERIVDLPPLESVGQIGMDEMWDNLIYFLEAVIPTAEGAGVQLAAHPNDPPIPEYRGVAQPLGDVEGMKRLIEVVDSPSNCIFYDTGVMTEKGADAVEMIRYFGSRNRIGTVHFRNVKVDVPRFKYLETFHDDGECDMFACVQAFKEVGYDGMLDPDHTPGILGDTPDTRIGWAFAIGQMVAMRNAVERST
ncbi:MAG: mannonate dehydratase [Candidatus Latescibacteria bacterium]|nr:mannonate dehydratase [Candidatus Latescibacterota bacterium]